MTGIQLEVGDKVSKLGIKSWKSFSAFEGKLLRPANQLKRHAGCTSVLIFCWIFRKKSSNAHYKTRHTSSLKPRVFKASFQLSNVELCSNIESTAEESDRIEIIFGPTNEGTSQFWKNNQIMHLNQLCTICQSCSPTYT